MTPRTGKYLDLELSYDHFSDDHFRPYHAYRPFSQREVDM